MGMYPFTRQTKPGFVEVFVLIYLAKTYSLERELLQFD